MSRINPTGALRAFLTFLQPPTKPTLIRIRKQSKKSLDITRSQLSDLIVELSDQSAKLSKIIK